MNYPTQSHALKSHIEDEPWKKQKLISLYFSLIPLVLWMTSNPSAFLGWLLVDGVRKQRGWVSACIFKRKKKKGSNIWKNMIFPTIYNQCEVKVENKLRKGGQSLICIECLMCNYYMLYDGMSSYIGNIFHLNGLHPRKGCQNLGIYMLHFPNYISVVW